MVIFCKRPYRLVWSRTQAFQAWYPGSNPGGAIFMISLDDFKKIDIRIGKVVSAERVPDSDKLILLKVDLGSETRQIVAGIAKIVSDPQELVGKELPVLINLEPKMLKGYESQGMILATDNNGEPVLLHPARDVNPGSVVK